MARYEAHQIWMGTHPDSFPFEQDGGFDCLRELRYPVMRALESSKDFSLEQDELLFDVLDRASRFRELCLGQSEAMMMIDELEDAGIPVNPPSAPQIVALISSLSEEADGPRVTELKRLLQDGEETEALRQELDEKEGWT